MAEGGRRRRWWKERESAERENLSVSIALLLLRETGIDNFLWPIFNIFTFLREFKFPK